MTTEPLIRKDGAKPGEAVRGCGKWRLLGHVSIWADVGGESGCSPSTNEQVMGSK